jgi:heptosyltransferase II
LATFFSRIFPAVLSNLLSDKSASSISKNIPIDISASDLVKRKSEKSQVLVVQTAFLGDLLLGVPFFRFLKSPEVEVTLICRRGLGSLMISLGLVDRVIELDKSNSKSVSLGWKNARGVVWDEVYAIHRSPRTQWQVARLRAKLKISYQSWYGTVLYNQAEKYLPEIPEPLRQISLLSSHPRHGSLVRATIDVSLKSQAHSGGWQSHLAGLTQLSDIPIGFDMLSPQLARIQEARRIEPVGDIRGPLRIAIAPGSVWATKRWQKESFIELMSMLNSKLGRRVNWLLLGSQSELELCQEIESEYIKRHGKDQVELMVGEASLIEVAEAYAAQDIVICHDSGAQHLASLSGVPTISIFGPTALELGYRPWNRNAVVVENKQIDCRPCGKHGAVKCPLGHHECMKSISPAQLERIVRETLARF